MSDLRSTIGEAVKTALKSGQKAELSVLRLIQAAIKQREVDERIVLNDEQLLTLLDKMLRQRRDSIAQFTAAGRPDLADKEQAELAIIQRFMPSPLSQTEIEQLIQSAMETVKPSSIKDMAKVMAIIKPQAQGRADLSEISQQIKTALNALPSA